MSNLPFTYMDRDAVMSASPYKSKSSLDRAMAAGRFPRPDYILSRPVWRSDRVAESLQKTAAAAEAARAEREQALAATLHPMRQAKAAKRTKASARRVRKAAI